MRPCSCSLPLRLELERRILRGIPNNLRGVAWAVLSDASDLVEKNPLIYERYQSLSNDAAEVPILLDIPRTYPDHPRFGANGTDTTMLYNVLKAFSNFNSEVGYTQGMSFIVAVLLMHMNEEVLPLLVFLPCSRVFLILIVERLLGVRSNAQKVWFNGFFH